MRMRKDVAAASSQPLCRQAYRTFGEAPLPGRKGRAAITARVALSSWLGIHNSGTGIAPIGSASYERAGSNTGLPMARKRGRGPNNRAGRLPAALHDAAAQLTGAAAGQLTAAIQSIHVHFPLSAWQAICAFLAASGAILAASATASFKLFVVIAAIGWMMSTGRLPENTAPVMSKVSFNLIIPCMLVSKVASTLAEEPSMAMLGVPVTAILQVSVGGLLGWLAAFVVEGKYPEEIKIFGYHPKTPPPAAAAIAASTAAAMSLPQVAPQLMPKPRETPRGFKQLVQLSCAFGNSLTLPLIFLLTLLPAHSADTAVAFTALFLAGWSPCLWSVGYEMVGSACSHPAKSSGNRLPAVQVFTATLLLSLPRRMFRASGTSRGGRVVSTSSGSAGTSGVDGFPTIDVTDSLGSERSKVVGFLVGVLESVKETVCRFMNPPLVGVIAGVAIGLSPLGPALLGPPSLALSGVGVSHLFELQVMTQMGRAAMEVVAMLGSATLAMQAVVLATSLKMPRPEDGNDGVQGKAILVKRRPRWIKLLFPSDPLEKRCLWAVFVVRMILMPLAGLGIVMMMSSLSLIPDDPVCRLALMLQSAMPSAQNLVMMLQLREETQPLASQMAVLLLRLYVLAVVPVTLWISLFMSVSGIV